MGNGLQNARAAALRSQLTADHHAFVMLLYRLEQNGLRATRRHLPSADRNQDRIRQKCAKAGVIVWRFGEWALTGQGIALARRIEARRGETLLSGSTAKRREPDGEAGAP